MKILNVSALEILDSRGNPTVEANLILEDGTTASAIIPSCERRSPEDRKRLSQREN